MHERDIFITAIQQASEADRAAYLDNVCGHDSSLRVGVEALIREHEKLGSFIESPAPELMAVVETPGQLQGFEPGSLKAVDRLETHVLGDYRLLREIARGGMGVVYEAEQISLGRHVALKVLPFASMLDKTQLVRFKNEARAAASLDHPNVVRVHSVGSERGVHYYAMQFIDGQTVADVIAGERRRRGMVEGEEKDGQASESRGSSPKDLTEAFVSSGEMSADTRAGFQPEALKDTANNTSTSGTIRNGTEEKEWIRRVVELGIQAAEALEHAHRMGIVHRDIKPSNLLLDSEQHLWVADFGLAMVEAEGSLSASGSMLGTLRYMSPEQVRGDRHVLDHHTDIYSLGATLYEMLTFQPAFPETDVARLMQRIPNDDPIAPRILVSSTPRDLDTIVLKAMAKRPEDRYTTAVDMAADLQRFLDDEPIQAKPPGAIERARKWARRHRAVVTTAVATLLLAVAVAGGLLWRERSETFAALNRETTQRELAEQQKRNAERQERLAKKQTALADEQKSLAKAQEVVANRERDLAYGNLYRADMRLVLSDVTQGNTRRLFQKLESYVPTGAQLDHRGWEWYYALSHCQQSERTLYEHGERTVSVAWSPDGGYVATTGCDARVVVWSTSDWEPVRIFQQGYTWKIGLLWSPDGARLACGSAANDNSIRIWNVQTESMVRLEGHVFSAQPLAWSPDGTLLASDGHFDDEGVIIWDTATGRRVQTLDETATTSLLEPDAPVDECFAVVSHKSIRIWDWDSLNLVMHVPTAYTHQPRYSWSPDGTRLLYGGRIGEDEGLALIHIGNRAIEWLEGTQIPKAGPVWSVGGRVATAASGGIVNVWDTSTWKLLRTLRGHRGDVFGISWSPDGKHLVSVGQDRSLRVWNADVPLERRTWTIYGGHKLQLSWSEDSRCLLTCQNGSVHLRDGVTGEVKQSWSDEKTVLARLSPDGKRLALARQDDGMFRIDVHDLSTGEVSSSMPTGIHFLAVGRAELAWSPGGDFVALRGRLTTESQRSGGVEVWNTRSGEQVLQIKQCAQHPGQHRAICFSPNGHRIAIEDEGSHISYSRVRLYDIPSGTLHNELTVSRHEKVTAIAWDATHDCLACGTNSGRIYLWNAEQGQLLHAVEAHLAEVTTLNWRPGGNRLVSGSDDATVKIWDALGNELLTLNDHVGTLSEVVFSPDGQQLASAGAGPNQDECQLVIYDASRGFRLAESVNFTQERAAARYDRASSLWGSMDSTEAMASICEALQLTPDNRLSLFYRGRMHVTLREPEEAIAALSRALHLDPEDYYSRVYLGMAYEQKQEFEAALREYSAAIRMVSGNPFGPISRAGLYARQQRWREAETDLREAMKSNPSSIYYYWIALLQLAQDNRSGYRTTCDEWMAYLSSHRMTFNETSTSQILWTCALGKDSLPGFDQLIQWADAPNATDLGDVRNALGAILYRAGRFQEAAAQLEDLAATWKDAEPASYSPAYTCYFLAMAYDRQGLSTQARRWLKDGNEFATRGLSQDEVPWNRTLTLELLRKEAEALLGSDEETDRDNNNSDENLPSPKPGLEHSGT